MHASDAQVGGHCPRVLSLCSILQACHTVATELTPPHRVGDTTVNTLSSSLQVSPASGRLARTHRWQHLEGDLRQVSSLRRSLIAQGAHKNGVRLQDAENTVQQCQAAVDQLALFSSNEDADDIATAGMGALGLASCVIQNCEGLQ